MVARINQGALCTGTNGIAARGMACIIHRREAVPQALYRRRVRLGIGSTTSVSSGRARRGVLRRSNDSLSGDAHAT